MQRGEIYLYLYAVYVTWLSADNDVVLVKCYFRASHSGGRGGGIMVKKLM